MRIESVGLLEHCKALLAGFFVLGLLLAFTLHAIHWVRDEVGITLCAEKVEAVVSNVTYVEEEWNDGRSGGYVQYFTYTFLSPSGRKITGQGRGGEEPLPRLIAVEYERGNPENCRTYNGRSLSRYLAFALLYTGAIFGAIVWVGGLAFTGCIGCINGNIVALWGGEGSRGPFPALTRFGRRAVTLLSRLYGGRIWGLWEWEGKQNSAPTRGVISKRVCVMLIAACAAEIVVGVTLGQIVTSGAGWLRDNAWLVLALIALASYAGLHAAVMVMYPKTR